MICNKTQLFVTYYQQGRIQGGGPWTPEALREGPLYSFQGRAIELSRATGANTPKTRFNYPCVKSLALSTWDHPDYHPFKREQLKVKTCFFDVPVVVLSKPTLSVPLFFPPADSWLQHKKWKLVFGDFYPKCSVLYILFKGFARLNKVKKNAVYPVPWGKKEPNSSGTWISGLTWAPADICCGYVVFGNVVLFWNRLLIVGFQTDIS